MSEAAGVFAWNIETNILYADTVVATLFGLGVDDAQTGLPIQAYLDRIHPQDCPWVAEAIHDAIISGLPYQAEYRVVHFDGTVHWVLAMGQCFRNRDGVPSEYSGVIYDVTSLKTAAGDGLLDHCQAALEVAQSLGQGRVVDLLTAALNEMDEGALSKSTSMQVRH